MSRETDYWRRWDRIEDLLAQGPRPWLDHDPCDVCGSEFPEHRCYMQEVAR